MKARELLIATMVLGLAPLAAQAEGPIDYPKPAATQTQSATRAEVLAQLREHSDQVAIGEVYSPPAQSPRAERSTVVVRNEAARLLAEGKLAFGEIYPGISS